MIALASPLHATVLNYIAEGRAEDPSGAGGVLLVVGIALAVLLIAASLLYFISRSFRSRREKNQSAETVERPVPSEQGRPWSSER